MKKKAIENLLVDMEYNIRRKLESQPSWTSQEIMQVLYLQKAKVLARRRLLKELEKANQFLEEQELDEVFSDYLKGY